MVIQRWQSVFLLIAAIAMALFCFMPTVNFITADSIYTMTSCGISAADGSCVQCSMVYFIVNCLIALLTFIIIFLFKDLKRQMKMTVISMLLTIASIATFAILTKMAATDLAASSTELLYGKLALPIITLLGQWLAYRGMARDRKKLASYDRIR